MISQSPFSIVIIIIIFHHRQQPYFLVLTHLQLGILLQHIF